MLNLKGVLFDTLYPLGLFSVYSSAVSDELTLCSPLHPVASFNQFTALVWLRIHKGRVDIKPKCWQLQFSFRLLQTDCNFFNVQKIWKEGTCC